MIYKKGKPDSPESFRNIALVNSIAKIFTRTLYLRLLEWCEANEMLPEAQSGFRSGRGCVDNVFVLQSLIQIQLRLETRFVYTGFMDFTRAFDTIEHNLLWSKLRNFGLSAQLIDVLQQLYNKASMQVKMDGELSKEFFLTRGLLQGELLSPILFAIFLSDIDSFSNKKVR